MTPAGIEPATFRFVAQHHNTVNINSNSVVTIHATCLALSHDKHSVRLHQYLSKCECVCVCVCVYVCVCVHCAEWLLAVVCSSLISCSDEMLLTRFRITYFEILLILMFC